MNEIFRIEAIDHSDCERVRSTLLQLSEFWRKRNTKLPLFTLGAATYIDSRPDLKTYYGYVKSDNPILWEHFEWVYQRLVVALGKYIGGPINFDHDQAVPGFHLYRFHPAFEKNIAEIHFDRQQTRLRWPENAEIDWSDPISFTLPIALPRTGGGLHTWEIDWQEFREAGSEARKLLIRDSSKTLHVYRLGELVVHSGNQLHQVAPGVHLSPEDERFTLQGHGLYCDGAWRLYW
ncbi:hypothetical protein MK489_13940 [Myxococcota bacterium]|nr:hypothetical protein [Myxococcota bacterium]